MKQTFFIGDTHFCHENIIKYEPASRPFKTIEEHDETLIERWNGRVGPKDTVWHVGDVLFEDRGFELLRRLNGHKKLVLGNHDDWPMRYYMEHFEEVYGYAVFQGHLLSHIPVDINQSKRFKSNIHAHLHTEVLPTAFHRCVSAEQINLTPISFEELMIR